MGSARAPFHWQVVSRRESDSSSALRILSRWILGKTLSRYSYSGTLGSTSSRQASRPPRMARTLVNSCPMK